MSLLSNAVPARLARAWGLSLSLTLALGASAFAGGAQITTVQAGPWNDPATWDLGVVPDALQGQHANVRHLTTVQSPAQTANVVRISGFTALEVLTGGSLASGTTVVGHEDEEGNFAQNGGTSHHGELLVGRDAFGSLSVSDGVLVADELLVGSDHLDPATPWAGGGIVIDGGDASVSAPSRFELGGTSSLTVRVFANGAAGLTTIEAGDVFLAPGAGLGILVAYPAEVGDSWDLLTYSGTLTGTFDQVFAAGFGVEVAVDTSTPGVVRAVVTSSPHPLPGQTCATAIPLLTQDTFVGSTQHYATDDFGPSCDQPFVTSDIWFRVENSGAEPACLSADLQDGFGSPLARTSLELWSDCGGTLLDCAGNGLEITQQAAVTWTAAPGESVLLRMARQTGAPVPYTLHVFPDGGWTELGGGSPGVAGVPHLAGTGFPHGGAQAGVSLTSGPPSAFILLWLSLTTSPLDALGGTVYAFPFVDQLLFATDGNGDFSASTTWPEGLPNGTRFFLQFICEDATVPYGLTLSNAVIGEVPSLSVPD